MPKQTKDATRIASEIVGTQIRFAFPTIESVSGSGEPVRFSIDAATLPENIREYAVLHGIKQKLVDAMAMGIATDAKTGRVSRPTIEDKARALIDVAKRLQSGVWNEEREGPVGGLLYQAMVRLYPDRWADAADFRAFIDAQATKRDVKPSAVEESLRRSPKVAETIEAIRAEMGKRSTVDADSILDELSE